MSFSKLRPQAQRVYIRRVDVAFDSSGYMQPKSITWDDGRTFQIDSIRDYRPAETICNLKGDCYTVLIQGQERHLFFERVDPMFTGRLGRWYVITNNNS